MKIFSTKNPKIKEIRSLQRKKKLRNQQCIILVEGKREIQMALKKYRPHELFIYKKKCDSLCSIEKKFPFVIEICKNVFQNLSYRKDSVGIIAIFHRHDLSIIELFLPKNPILLILVGIEKPGNLGAIIRSAESIGLDAIILSEIKIDIFHVNVCRSSLGTIFIHNVIIYQTNELINWLKKKYINILATSIKENTTNIYESKLQSGIAIIVGNESIGLTISWINNSDRILKIPMYGNIDSLNVSNAVAIILFEALRQRMKT